MNKRTNHRAFGYATIALTLAAIGSLSIAENKPVFAQLTPDNTLGTENSIVTPQLLRDLIQGGAIRGNALFHSFDEFNVQDGGSVFFDLQNNTDILSIFTRVTGGNVSNILGTLGVLQDALNSDVLGNANLFLLNPNGITFGQNANLQLNGSFFATTADSFDFDNFTFSASGEETPPPLLTVSIPRFLSFRDNPGEIAVSQSNLSVNQGQNLSLVGGNVTVTGSGDIENQTLNLNAPDGRIEIGSVASSSAVSLTQTDAGLVLDYVGIETFGDITFNQAAFVDTSGDSGGSIQLQGRDITLGDRTLIFANTTGAGIGGGIVVNSEQLILEDGSRLTADVSGLGQGGNINIATSDLLVQDGAGVSSDTFGVGNAGNLTITTSNLTLQDGSSVSSSAFGEGNGGILTINATDSIEVIGISQDGQFRSNLAAQTFSTGDAGDVNITTSNLLVEDGAFVVASTFGQGDAGNITITTSNLLVEDGAFVSSDVFGEGNGGILTINATDSVEVIGASQNQDGQFSRLSAQTFYIGNAGDVNITTPNLLVKDTAFVSADTFEGEGNAGNLTITTSSLLVEDGAGVSSNTFGPGNAGNLTITTSNLIAQNSSSVRAETFGSGNAGNLTITTSNLTLQDGSSVSSSAFGEGNGGILTINATDSIEVIGVSQDGRFSSRLSAQTFSTGNAGNLTITTPNLLVKDRAFVVASTFGQGDAGNITITTSNLLVEDGAFISSDVFGEGNGGILTINATDSVEVVGASQDGQFSSLSAQTFYIGDAGDVNITTSNLLVEDGAFVRVETFGVGDAGNLTITTSNLLVQNGAFVGVGATSVNNSGTGTAGDLTIISNNLTLNNGTISAQTTNTDGGNITLDIADLLLLRNGNGDVLISATAGTEGGQGNGGNLTIDTTFLVAFPYENSDITANASEGRGGNINITADGVFGIQFRNALTDFSDITATSDVGIAGTVILNTPETEVNQEQVEQPEALVDDSDIIAQTACYDFGGDSQLANTGRGGVPQIPGFIIRNDVVNVDLVDEVLPAPPTQAIKPHHRTDVTFLDSEGEEFKPAMGAVLLPNGMVEFVDYNPAEVYRDMYAAGCSSNK